MIIPDLIITQPTHVDFPIFRYNLKRFRNYFDHVYIGLSKHAPSPDYANFFREDLKDMATFVQVPANTPGDWRNNIVREILLYHSKAPYVLFLEQDFLIRDVRLFEVILNSTLDYNTVLYDENGRIHPAFALVPRELVDNTSMDFSANPEAGYDHFGKFFRELSTIANACDVTDLGLVDKMDFYHMAGLTNNYQRVLEDLPPYKPQEFLTYNDKTILLDIPQPAEFKQVCEFIHNEYGSGKDPIIAGFFPIV